MQQSAGIYLLQNYCTCFGRPSHPSSGVHKTVTAASGTGPSNNLPPMWPEGLQATLEGGVRDSVVIQGNKLVHCVIYQRLVLVL